MKLAASTIHCLLQLPPQLVRVSVTKELEDFAFERIGDLS